MSQNPNHDRDITINLDFEEWDGQHHTAEEARYYVHKLDYSHINYLGWGGSRVSIKDADHALAMLDIIKDAKDDIWTAIREGHEALRLGHIHYGEEVFSG